MKKTLFIATVIGLVLPFSAFASFDRNLKIGMSGNDVNELQNILVDQGCLNVSPTGYFGLLTFKGVQCFQTKNGISSTGYVGVLTRGVVNKLTTEAVDSSNSAEIAETGTTTNTGVCISGATYNYLTGLPCQTNNNLSNQITRLQNQVTSLENTIQSQNNKPLTGLSPIVQMQQPTVSISVNSSECISDEKIFGTTSPISFIPLNIKGNYQYVSTDLEGQSISSKPGFLMDRGHIEGEYWIWNSSSDKTPFGWTQIPAGIYQVSINTYDNLPDKYTGYPVGTPTATYSGTVTVNSCSN